MKIFFYLFIFILGIEINAMNLLEFEKNQENFILKKWEYVSDQVMGGVSSGKLEFLSENNQKYLRLSGKVSTENNGGFIQFRSGFNFDNNEYKGIRLKIRGNPSEYFIHIRTVFLFLPWQYYSGKFFAEEGWSQVEILFEDFEKSNFYQPSTFSPSDIKSIGFVAFGKDFDAQLDLMEAEVF